MSRENVRKFYELVKNNEGLSKTLEKDYKKINLIDAGLLQLKNMLNETIIPIAQKQKLDFSADELLDYANEKYIQLNDEDLHKLKHKKRILIVL